MRIKTVSFSIFPHGSSIKEKKIPEIFTVISAESIIAILFLEAQCFEERRNIHH